ncbi:Sortase family protein [Auraticoccus monumenti]|uniref:Sortase family protein n=1 Tax=Auraticoccus monumenti TaxID=675864 RepID=A0A1G6S217_9ACTN|nr:Sortase family protein [Auraticoccus monumenti]
MRPHPLPGLVGAIALCACTLAGAAAPAPVGAAALAPVPVGAPTASSTEPPPGPTARPAPEPTRSTRPVTSVPVRPARQDDRRAPSPERLTVGGWTPMDVVPVGVTEQGRMELPTSPDVVGWYRFGPSPAGERGSVVLAAHVDSLDRVGPFAGLASLPPGTEVTVRTDDGRDHRYRVEHGVRLEKEDVPLEDLFDRDSAPRLVLITCGGPFDPEDGYRDNVVVTAVPV